MMSKGNSTIFSEDKWMLYGFVAFEPSRERKQLESNLFLARFWH